MNRRSFLGFIGLAPMVAASPMPATAPYPAVFGVPVASAVGTVAIFGGSVGGQYKLHNPADVEAVDRIADWENLMQRYIEHEIEEANAAIAAR